MRLPIRYRIILPFVVLLVFVGVIGTGVATARLTNTAAAEFNANLLHSSLLANQSLSQIDVARMGDLRRATDTLGVPEAVAAKDIPTLARLLTPLAGNVIATAPSVELRVLDAYGKEILRVQNAPSGPGLVPVSDASAFASEPAVIKALAGERDGLSNRTIFLSTRGAQARLYWVGPVHSGGRIPGAILLGQSLSEIVATIPGLALYDLSGAYLASTLEKPPVISESIRRQIPADNSLRVEQTLGGHAYGALFSTWVMRGHQFGFIAAEADGDGLQSSVMQVRLILTLVFTAAALLTLLVGTVTAALLTRPIDALVRSMRAVSAGDLQHRASVGANDEIGYLARTFNEMTASLEEKTVALEETTFASMEALARAIDARDPSTYGHSARVAAVSREIADAMQLGLKDQEALRRGALLHDIGKIGVEDRVLRKPGPLDQAEADNMREHPQTGYDILKGLPFLKPSLAGVLYHHERWDGAGYPAGLTGTAIPLIVRILTVADVFDALTSDRPYRQGLSFEAAAHTIQQDAGVRFDPDVVSAFLARRPTIETLLRKLRRQGISLHEREAA